MRRNIDQTTSLNESCRAVILLEISRRQPWVAHKNAPFRTIDLA